MAIIIKLKMYYYSLSQTKQKSVKNVVKIEKGGRTKGKNISKLFIARVLFYVSSVNARISGYIYILLQVLHLSTKRFVFFQIFKVLSFRMREGSREPVRVFFPI